MTHTAAARAFENLAGVFGAMGRLHLGDLRSVYVWALVRVAAAAVRRPAGQSGRDVYRRYRYRSWAACRRAIDVPAGHLGFETGSPQPMIIALLPARVFVFFLGRHLHMRAPGGGGPATPCSLPNGDPRWSHGLGGTYRARLPDPRLPFLRARPRALAAVHP